MSIKYYHLAKDEELPDEFCAVRDVGGEPSEYTFYVPESEVAKLREEIEAAKHDLQVFSIRSVQLDAENAKLRDELDAAKHDLSLFSERIVELGAENAKLRELVRCLVYATNPLDRATLIANAAELGIEVNG